MKSEEKYNSEIRFSIFFLERMKSDLYFDDYGIHHINSKIVIFSAYPVDSLCQFLIHEIQNLVVVEEPGKMNPVIVCSLCWCHPLVHVMVSTLQNEQDIHFRDKI